MASKTSVQLQGELQIEVMRALWRLGQGGVEDVRRALRPRRRSAYTTVQTVLNRLSERGLLERERQGKAILYTPKISEADYYSRSVRHTLANASDDARRSVLARLVGDMKPEELDEIGALAREVAKKRARRRPK